MAEATQTSERAPLGGRNTTHPSNRSVGFLGQAKTSELGGSFSRASRFWGFGFRVVGPRVWGFTLGKKVDKP